MTVVWERKSDSAGAARRWSRFGLFFGIPAALGLVIAAAFGGFGPFLGVLIVVVLAGLLVGGGIFFRNLGSRMNPTITREGDELVWARRRVPIAQVTQWSTFMGSVAMAMPSPGFGAMSAKSDMGYVRFRTTDGSDTEFAFPHLTPAELETLRAALTPHLPLPWRPVEGWYDA